MGLFEHFPYTNMHELNLSWLLQAMKKLQEDYEAFKVQVEETVEAFRLQMDGWEERIADLEASWAALQAEWVAFQAEISGQMDGWEDRISGLESAWTSYQTAMDIAFNEFEATVTSLISGWDERISTLETSWTNYQDTIDSAMQSFEESINSAMQGFEAEIRGELSAMAFQDVSEAFSQNGAVGRMGRQAYQISNMVHGILSFRDGWTGEQESLVIDVDGLSLPGHGMYYLYRCQLPGYVLEAQPFVCGWFNSLNPEPKRGSKNYNLSQEPANIVEPKKTRAGGYIINIPDFVKEYLIEYPDYAVLMVFEYVPSDREV